MSQHLEDRLKHLENTLEHEKKLKKPSQFYIEDLELTIKQVKQSIRLTAKPYQIVNGAEPE